jgi:hypothetical protein
MFTINDYNTGDCLTDSLFAIENNHPYMRESFYRSLSTDKLEQTMWLYEGLTHCLDNVDGITANWYAPGFCYYKSVVAGKLNFKNITFYDYDPTVRYVNHQSTKHLKNVNIEHSLMDVVFDRSYINKEVDLVINQSCSSMVEQNRINSGYGEDVLLAYQGSDTYKRGNITIYKDIDNFIESTGITNILFSGSKKIKSENKFMVIGNKKK